MTGVFHHEAVLCHGHAESTAATLDYLREGVDEGATTTMVAGARRTREIQRALGTDARAIRFETVEEIGTNPARLIPFWAAQVEASATAGRRLHALSEALEPESSAELITEFGVNESSINVAFDAGPAWSLLCPYDLEAHRPATIEVVRETHPFLTENGVSGQNPSYRPREPFAGTLSSPPAGTDRTAFTSKDLARVRRFAAASARHAGLPERADDVALVVSELTSNSVRYGGGTGGFSLWATDDGLVCEISDAGRITDPLAGRERPYRQPGRIGGAGLWIANSLSDLVQIRSGASGTRIRVHFDRAAGAAG